MQTRLNFDTPPRRPRRSTPGHHDGGSVAGGGDGVLQRAFHPAVAEWFEARFGAPTTVQTAAWEVTTRGGHALIAAPTGSGKTLAAFLGAINALIVEGLQAPLVEAVHVLYVSPLKALSNDVQKNLQEPLLGIRQRLTESGEPDVLIRDGVRTGDTPMGERERMRRHPPHILVTTPESLFILLTSDSGRRMLRQVRTVIVDELHAVAGNKRGAHLALSLQRLDALCERPPTRIGLSATVKPIEEMAQFLIGERAEPVAIIDTGHVRDRDLGLELPRSPLGAVMANEVWGEIYDRLAELVQTHRTTLIFVNQRRMAERAARHLAERLGEEHVTAHHGSLSRAHRLKAEQRLKSGQLKALVATSALELGIDIGDIDLVCQLGSPRSLNAFLQRVGRAGHAVRAIPKGRLFPLSLDDLLESVALLSAVRHGELDHIRTVDAPLDVLAQQIVAEAAVREWSFHGLYQCFRAAQPYRALPVGDFENVVKMLADGYSTRRGRRGAYLHYDAVNQMIRARRGAKIVAVTNAGVIPDQFDYDVVLMPEESRVGTVGEDFAFESIPGDVFQLGNMAYRIAKVETGKVYVQDADGQAPNIPFWFGEAPSRTIELSTAVADICKLAEQQLASLPPEALEETQTLEGLTQAAPAVARCAATLSEHLDVSGAAAQMLAAYLTASYAALGALPTLETILIERFFDEVGDTHVVIHSPYGSRLNRAWGLALRKRFCRTFNFELQASALEDSIVLSLGPTHSFPLESIKDFLKSATVRDVLIQALLDAPMFGLRWRRDASVALAIPRMRNGRRTPPQFQRSDAEDLLTVVFPDQVACAENLTGPREIPDHPLVKQTIGDCLHDTMDIDGLEALLARIERGEVRVIARDLTAPSPMAHAILNARPYAFLDDGEAEERRTRSVSTGSPFDLSAARALGHLDPRAIARVRDDAQPEIRSADELHDALVVYAFLTRSELNTITGNAERVAAMLGELQKQRRTSRLAPAAEVGDESVTECGIFVAAERLHEFHAAFGIAERRVLMSPSIEAASTQRPDADAGLREILRSRLELLGPVTTAALATPLVAAGFSDDALTGRMESVLGQLEHQGVAMRGAFSTPEAEEWCDRSLLARIHRYTRNERRAMYQPVAPAQFIRFLFRWQGVSPIAAATAASWAPAVDARRSEAALQAVLQQLEGVSAPAVAWERALLPLRMQGYQPDDLDRLCTAGRIAWCRPRTSESGDGRLRGGPVANTPILFSPRESLRYWQDAVDDASDMSGLSSRASRLLTALRQFGASFMAELGQDSGLLRSELEEALGELVSQGLVHCDSYAGLRALIMPAEKRGRLQKRFPSADLGLDRAGRWSLVRGRASGPGAAEFATEFEQQKLEHIARSLLKRYGVVFRMLVDREDGLPPWRELHGVYRRLEARGEICGGRFVSQFSGEQFALSEAAASLRSVAAEATDDDSSSRCERILISAADPLNLVGVLTPGDKVPRIANNLVLFENGVPIATLVGGEVRLLKEIPAGQDWTIRSLLMRGLGPAKRPASTGFQAPQGLPIT